MNPTNYSCFMNNCSTDTISTENCAFVSSSCLQKDLLPKESLWEWDK